MKIILFFPLTPKFTVSPSNTFGCLLRIPTVKRRPLKEVYRNPLPSY